MASDVKVGDTTFTAEEFDLLVRRAMGLGGAASRGITREAGELDPADNGIDALLRSAAAIALGRQTSRSFTPYGLELMNRVADEVVRRVSAESDAQLAKAVH